LDQKVRVLRQEMCRRFRWPKSILFRLREVVMHYLMQFFSYAHLKGDLQPISEKFAILGRARLVVPALGAAVVPVAIAAEA
jgi:hypothetical protein